MPNFELMAYELIAYNKLILKKKKKKNWLVTFFPQELITYFYYVMGYFDKLIQLAYSLSFFLPILPLSSNLKKLNNN
jgi:hypothetical protein